MGPARLGSMADGMKRVLSESALLVGPGGESLVDEFGKLRLIDWLGYRGRKGSGWEMRPK
jgi:hypothetical protein